MCVCVNDHELMKVHVQAYYTTLSTNLIGSPKLAIAAVAAATQAAPPISAFILSIDAAGLIE